MLLRDETSEKPRDIFSTLSLFPWEVTTSPSGSEHLLNEQSCSIPDVQISNPWALQGLLMPVISPSETNRARIIIL